MAENEIAEKFKKKLGTLLTELALSSVSTILDKNWYSQIQFPTNILSIFLKNLKLWTFLRGLSDNISTDWLVFPKMIST